MDSIKRKILFVTPEIVPYKATGGLADVAEALPEALADEGEEVIRIMPKYAGIEDSFNLEKVFSFLVEAGERVNVADIYKIDEGNLTTYFIGNDNYFERDSLYGYEDDGERFGFFCKAVLEFLIFSNIKPDIIHLNDWQSALIGLLIKEEYKEIDFYKNIKIVFTIHNLQYQGVFDVGVLYRLNLPNHYFHPDKLEYYGKVCFMKAGIIYSDLVTTVSETYSNEIQTPAYGYGLDGLLRRYSRKIKGILNGIYYEKYDPMEDPEIKVPFSSENVIEKRKENKALLQEEVGLPQKDVPLLGVVTRLAEQKGIDLIMYAINNLIENDVQLIILGSGEEEYESKLMEIESKYPEQIKLNVEFNQGLARRIYASSDFFLMPSLFEPCGLSQMYSLRYGSIPIVRETGGLLDTILDYNKDKRNGVGFSFKEFDGNEFLDAINRGLETYKVKRSWNALIRRGMKKRFSWEKSAKTYISLYEKILNHF